MKARKLRLPNYRQELFLHEVQRANTPISRIGKLLIVALMALLPIAVGAQDVSPGLSGSELLVNADWLAQAQQDAKGSRLLVLQVDTAPKGYTEAHIPGAGYLPYGELVRNRDVEGGTLITEFPETDALGQVFQRVGVHADSHVVLYGHPVYTARAFLTLEQMGHNKVSLLDGGLEAWLTTGRATESGDPADPENGTFKPQPRTDILVDAEWVNQQLTEDQFAIIDARPLGEYTGADGGRNGRFKIGHIPGATNLYWEELVQASGPGAGRFLDTTGLQKRFSQAGLDKGKTIVSYCFIGMRASVNYFLARTLDHPAKFYDGSWNDWSLTDFEAETGPDPSAPFSEIARRDENGSITLFDGFTMTGWKANENPDSWKLVDGTLTCEGPRSHLFFVGGDGEEDNTFTDFELTAEVKTTKKSNSGIYFHTRYQDSGWPQYGFEAQVNQTSYDTKKTGSLYDVKNVTEQLVEDDTWYTQIIRVEGRKITFKINGKVVMEYEQPEGQAAHSEEFERLVGSGTFALQAHDPKSKASFRNIRVRRLN